MYCAESHISAGIMPLMFTYAICFDLNEHGFDERYCFPTLERAYLELIAWHGRKFNDQRPIGWVACRGIAPSVICKSIQTYHGLDYAKETLMAYQKLPFEHQVGNVHEKLATTIDKHINDIKHELAFLRLAGKVI